MYESARNTDISPVEALRIQAIEETLLGHVRFRPDAWEDRPDPLGYRPEQPVAHEWIGRNFPGSEETVWEGCIVYMTKPFQDGRCHAPSQATEFFIHNCRLVSGELRWWHWWSDMTPEEKALHAPASEADFNFLSTLISERPAAPIRRVADWQPGEPPLKVIGGGLEDGSKPAAGGESVWRRIWNGVGYCVLKMSGKESQSGHG